jgi:hypothetical protein
MLSVFGTMKRSRLALHAIACMRCCYMAGWLVWVIASAILGRLAAAILFTIAFGIPLAYKNRTNWGQIELKPLINNLS